MTFRPFIPGRLGVGPDQVWVADWALPVVVAINAQGTAVDPPVAWAEHTELAGLPAVADLVVEPGGAWVAAPSAGGLVRIADGLAEIVPLPIVPSRLAVDGPFCWAASEYSLGQSDEGGQVWRVGPQGAQRVDVGGRSSRIAAGDGALYALVHRAGDEPVEQVHPGGGSTMLYPGALVRVGADGDVEVVAEFDQLPAQLIWVSGHLLVAVGYELAEVDLRRGRLGDPVEMPPPIAPIATPIDLGPHHIAGHAIDHDAVWVRTHDELQRAREDGRVLRVALPWAHGLTGPAEIRVDGSLSAMAVVDGVLWATRGLLGTGLELLRVDSSSGHMTTVNLGGVDLWPYLPSPRPPRGIDPPVHADGQRVKLEQALTQMADRAGGWSLARVFARKYFPDTEVVALWAGTASGADRPRSLGRPWRVFDDAGNLRRLVPAAFLPTHDEPNLAAVAMTVFICGVCGAEITRPVELLESPPPPPEDPLGGSGQNWIPVGYYVRDVDLEDLTGGPIVNEDDLSGTRPHPDRSRSVGCCGPDGSWGPNIVCVNDHEVATRVADCYQVHGVWLATDTTTQAAEP